MPYDPVTPEQFKAVKPQFADVDEAVIQSYLDLAAIWVDESWPESVHQPAIMAVACHLMTLDGLGADAASKSFAKGSAEYQSIRTGNVTLTRFRSASEGAGQSTSGWFNQTACGRQFMVWARMFRGGPRVAIGCGSGRVTAYAKDAYRDAWWPGC